MLNKIIDENYIDDKNLCYRQFENINLYINYIRVINLYGFKYVGCS